MAEEPQPGDVRVGGGEGCWFGFRLNAGERETQMKFVGGIYVNLRLPTRLISLEGVN